MAAASVPCPGAQDFNLKYAHWPIFQVACVLMHLTSCIGPLGSGGDHCRLVISSGSMNLVRKAFDDMSSLSRMREEPSSQRFGLSCLIQSLTAARGFSSIRSGI